MNFWQEHITHVILQALVEAQPQVRCSVNEVVEVKQVTGTQMHRHHEEVSCAYMYDTYRPTCTPIVLFFNKFGSFLLHLRQLKYVPDIKHFHMVL